LYKAKQEAQEMLLYKAEVNDLNEALEELENEMQTAVTVALDKAYDMFGKEKKQLVEKIQNLECERQEMISSHRVQEDNSVELEQALREVQQLRSLSDSRESLLRSLSPTSIESRSSHPEPAGCWRMGGISTMRGCRS